MSYGEQACFPSERRVSQREEWVAMAAVLENSTYSDLDGFSVIRTRCANASGPLHLTTGRPSLEQRARLHEGSAACWLPAGHRCRVATGLCGRWGAGLSPNTPSPLLSCLLTEHGSDQAQLRVPTMNRVRFLLEQSFSRV